MLTLSMTVSNSGNGSSTYTQLALPAWMVKQYRSHLDQYVGTTYQLIVNMIDPQKTPLSDHLYWNHYTDMSAKHDILSGRTQQPRMHRVGIDAINAAAHGHLVAMAHLAQAPSAIVHLSGDFTPTAKALLWHTPPAIRKTTSAEELSREWVYDIFFDPTLPRHELEAFHHELGPLDPLRQEPPDREFHDDRYLTDHQRVLEIGNRVNFNTLSL
jgi:hypothetical protein